MTTALAWTAEPADRVASHLLHAASRREFAGTPVEVDDPVLAASLEEQNRAAQWEYAYRWPGPVLIEPTHGYVCPAPGRLVLESVPYAWQVGLPPPLPAEPDIRVPAVVSLREDGDGNYYHFLDDLLGRLDLFDRVGVDDRVPLLVRSELTERDYFRCALRLSPRLRRREWLVQRPGSVVEAGEVVFGKALPHARGTLNAVADLFPGAYGDPAGRRRVLLVRDPRRGRHLRGQAAVEQLCRERGFEVVDTDRLDLAEQIELFRGVRHVVAPHGAGLANLLWRRGAPCSLLELFPPDATPAHYHWLCASYGFSYDALRGDVGSAAGGFGVDLDRLADALDRLLRR